MVKRASRTKAPRKGGEKDTEKSWRKFETLVARIEQTLAPQDAVVTSPDMVPDAISGEMREVDATIRYKIGSADILIMIECRERGRPADSTWLEQLHSKQKAIGANKCIAVSNKGFSKGAQSKAASYGIDLRHFNQISDTDIQSWAPQATWWFNMEVKVLSFILGNKNGEKIPKEEEDKVNRYLDKNRDIGISYLKSINEGADISPWQYMCDIINLSYDDMRKEGKTFPLNKDLIISFAQDPVYAIDLPRSRKVTVLGIGAKLIFKHFHDCAIEHIESVSYESRSGEIAQAHKFRIDLGLASEEFTVFKDPNLPHKFGIGWREGFQRSDKGSSADALSGTTPSLLLPAPRDSIQLSTASFLRPASKSDVTHKKPRT